MCSSSRSRQGGFTIVELLVASTLGLVILAIAAESAISNQRLYQQDLVRTRVNQDVRSAMDILGMNIRQAGENLVASFPAVEIISGGGSAPDTLVLRRNLLDEVLNLCTGITAGSNVQSIYVATAGATSSSCIRTNQMSNFSAWQGYRGAGQVRAYLFNTATKAGEFFDYAMEVDTGTALYLTTTPRVWANDYSVGASSLYMLEEWRFSLETSGSDTYLQLIEDGLSGNPLNVVHGITNFQVSIDLQDGTTVESFDPTAVWTQIRSVNVTLTGEDDLPRGGTVSREITGRFFPRNILSW